MAQRFPKLFLLLLGALFILNLLQSHFTQLIYDESYYWYYAQNLAWGYFDHPPMVALMIKISSKLFDGELGVRFISCLLSVGTYVLIWSMVGKPKKNTEIWLLAALLFSMPLFNAYGFLTLPDTPLLFFTALFLYCYRKFLGEPTVVYSIFLGLSMAGLMYSKYHAVLVIVFVIVSNWKLVLNKHAWLAVFVSLVCYLPHILWLYHYDFVTIKYHLFERPNHAYDFAEFTLGYFLNLIIIFGLLFVWFYWALFKNLKSKDLFVKALVYLSLGIIVFFFVSSFDRRVQTQWVVVICVPMAILTHRFITAQKINVRWVFRLAIVSCAILLFARVGLVYEPLFPVHYETHGNKEWTNELREKSNGVPVVFENSYRRASMYAFYTDVPTFSLNNIHFRLNQYSIDSSETKVQHKNIVYVTQYAKKGDINYSHPDGTVDYGFFRRDFESFRKLECILQEKPIDLNKTEISVKIYNPYDEDIDFDKLRLFMAYLNEYKQLLKKSQLPISEHSIPETLKSKDTLEVLYKLPQQNVEDAAYVKFGISENGLQPGINSPSIKIKS
ncbi:glycosyltransferase family 39 protein [Allomuricauda sp. d1]|uniref:ArnT family glycosyltransferase n=1 Tax=Allomuricauda sp. d1 TaxID=3136725 RepID=UPI0031CDB0F4